MSVFKLKSKSHLESPMFFGEPVDIARYDTVRYSQFEKLTDKQLGFFWRPEEIDLSKDRKDFHDLNEFEQHIFTSNLKRQILLDSVQGRSPNLAFLPMASVPELEVMVETWAFFETIHSRSYTHIIKNVYSNPSEVFDTILDDEQIIARAKSVTQAYDEFIDYANRYTVTGEGDMRTLKKKLYMAMISVNALEGIRFFVSFACSFAFGELKLMEGSAKIIGLISRDEAQHLAISQHIIKNWQKGDDPEMQEIFNENYEEIGKIYDLVVNEEKEWADYLFSRGAIVGLNERLLHQYIEYIGNRRLKGLGVEQRYDRSANDNPLPWTEHWTSSKGLQVAPQETEIESYVIGGIKQDVSKDTFAGFKL